MKQASTTANCETSFWEVLVLFLWRRFRENPFPCKVRYSRLKFSYSFYRKIMFPNWRWGKKALLSGFSLLPCCRSVCVPGEGCGVETEQQNVPPALRWAGLSSLAHLDGSLNCTFGSWSEEGVQVCSRVCGGFKPDPLGFNLVQRKKCPSWILLLDWWE